MLVATHVFMHSWKPTHTDRVRRSRDCSSSCIDLAVRFAHSNSRGYPAVRFRAPPAAGSPASLNEILHACSQHDAADSSTRRAAVVTWFNPRQPGSAIQRGTEAGTDLAGPARCGRGMPVVQDASRRAVRRGARQRLLFAKLDAHLAYAAARPQGAPCVVLGDPVALMDECVGFSSYPTGSSRSDTRPVALNGPSSWAMTGATLTVSDWRYASVYSTQRHYFGAT